MRNEILSKIAVDVATYEELRYILKGKKTREICGLMRVKLYPKDARDILKNFSARNRVLSLKLVRDYKKALLEGKWSTEAPETIAFDKEGRMFDGNHRTHSIAECEDENFFVIVNVALGCNKNPYTDTGKHRTPDDNLLCMGYVPADKEEYFSKYILKAIGTIGNLQGIRSNVDSMVYVREAIENNTDVFVTFQKRFNVGDKTAKEFRRIPILAAALNLFIQDIIDEDDVAHIANVLHNVYSVDFIRTNKDTALLQLARVSGEYRGGGEVIKKNLFALANNAIIAYKKGFKSIKIQKPQDRTTLELPMLYQMNQKKEMPRKMA